MLKTMALNDVALFLSVNGSYCGVVVVAAAARSEDPSSPRMTTMSSNRFRPGAAGVFPGFAMVFCWTDGDPCPWNGDNRDGVAWESPSIPPDPLPTRYLVPDLRSRTPVAAPVVVVVLVLGKIVLRQWEDRLLSDVPLVEESRNPHRHPPAVPADPLLIPILPLVEAAAAVALPKWWQHALPFPVPPKLVVFRPLPVP